MIQRLLLTPANPTLIGAYNPKADKVIVECDGDFTATLPALNFCESVEFEFYNTGTGVIRIEGTRINYDYDYMLLYAGESVVIIDNLRGTWLAGGVHVTPRFGDVENGNYIEIEPDGTLVRYGNATTWEDVGFPLIVKTTGTGRPTYASFTGTLESLQWGINDIAQAIDNEVPHAHKLNSTMTWHVHFYTAVQDAADRYVKWEIAYAGSGYGGTVPAETVISAEVLIPANTPIRTHYILDIGTYTPVSESPGHNVKARLKRIAASGTAPSVNPFCELMQLHYERDTDGSRSITTK
jgi:hypothetical protein